MIRKLNGFDKVLIKVLFQNIISINIFQESYKKLNIINM